MKELHLADDAATRALGEALATQLPADTGGWLVLLQGDLGAGKSTLARAMIRRFGHDGPVPSPTYTLIEPYDLDARRVYHVDLYRLSSAEELTYLGWDELDDGLCLVEWPERAPALADSADLRIALAYDGEGRRATLTAPSRRGQAWLTGFDYPG